MSSLVPPIATTPIRITLRAGCVRAVPGQTAAAMPIEAKSFRRLIMLSYWLAEILYFVTSTEHVEQGADFKDESCQAGLPGLNHKQTSASVLFWRQGGAVKCVAGNSLALSGQHLLRCPFRPLTPNAIPRSASSGTPQANKRKRFSSTRSAADCAISATR